MKPRPGEEDWELRSAKEQVASTLSALLVALPIWWFHRRRFSQLSREKADYWLYKVYSYLVMIVGLIGVVVRGGSTISQVVRAALGVLELSRTADQIRFANDVAGAILGTLLAAGVWYVHWRTVEVLPDTLETR